MATYRVLKRSFINNQIVEEGELVEYAGKPGSNLEPIEKPKPMAKAPVLGKKKTAEVEEPQFTSDEE